MNTGRAYDRVVDKYSDVYGNNPEYNYAIERFMQVVKKGKLLDIGCGNGLPTTKMMKTHGYDLVGVDVSKKMLEAAKINVPKVDFIHDDIRKLDLEKESFDGIYALFTFNHFKKKELPKLVAKLYEALKYDGAILLSVAEGNFEGKSVILGEKVYWKEYTEEELKILFKDFDIHSIEKMEFKPGVEGEPMRKHIFLIAQKKFKEESLEPKKKKGLITFKIG
jgi:ubiquinone/menaquinone biosynthesis C-methylase UbiE